MFCISGSYAAASSMSNASANEKDKTFSGLLYCMTATVSNALMMTFSGKDYGRRKIGRVRIDVLHRSCDVMRVASRRVNVRRRSIPQQIFRRERVRRAIARSFNVRGRICIAFSSVNVSLTRVFECGVIQFRPFRVGGTHVGGDDDSSWKH